MFGCTTLPTDSGILRTQPGWCGSSLGRQRASARINCHDFAADRPLESFGALFCLTKQWHLRSPSSWQYIPRSNCPEGEKLRGKGQSITGVSRDPWGMARSACGRAVACVSVSRAQQDIALILSLSVFGQSHDKDC